MKRTIGRLAAMFCAAAVALGGCASGGPRGDDATVIRGELTHRGRIALPADAVAVVELTRPKDGRVLAEQRIDLAGRQVPIAFELRVPRAWLQENERYALRGAIRVQGQATWLSDPFDVRPARGVIDTGALELRAWETVAFASRLQCGERSARVGMVKAGSADVTRMTVDGERYEMNGIVSASGALYEAAGDPTTQLWVKGDRATLTLRGEKLPECSVIRESPDTVRARGNEPFWSLELGTALRFTTPDVQLEGTAPPAQIAGGVRRHSGTVNGRPVNVVLTTRVCRDTMTGMPFPYTAEVTVSGQTFRGCGGEPDSLLLGDDWVVESIDGRVIDRARPTLDFGVDGRLAGRASCNVYTSSYTLSGEGLTIGTMATTMSSCPPALQEQEKLFLEILQRARGFDISDDGALELKDDRGRRIIARRPTAGSKPR